MKRRNFLAGLGFIGMPLSSFAFAELKNSLPRTDTLPALFIGHGSPMNAIESNRFSEGWPSLGKTLPKLAVILCISAH